MTHALAGLAIGGGILLAAVASYMLGTTDRNTESQVVVKMSRPIYELTLSDLQGQPQSVGQWRGKILIVNYWATWCHPCREEMPGFSRLQTKYVDKGVQFVGISIDTPVKIIEFQEKTPVSYPLLIGDIGVMESSAELGNTRQALPFTAVFDRNGKLHSTKLGRFSETALERQLLDLLSR
jgi:thiol-disulfide isomerase/thioredoxin